MLDLYEFVAHVSLFNVDVTWYFEWNMKNVDCQQAYFIWYKNFMLSSTAI